MTHQRLCLRMFCGYLRLVIRGGGRSLFRSRTFLGRVSFFPWPFVSRLCFSPVFFCCCVFSTRCPSLCSFAAVFFPLNFPLSALLLFTLYSLAAAFLLLCCFAAALLLFTLYNSAALYRLFHLFFRSMSLCPTLDFRWTSKRFGSKGGQGGWPCDFCISSRISHSRFIRWRSCSIVRW